MIWSLLVTFWQATVAAKRAVTWGSKATMLAGLLMACGKLAHYIIPMISVLISLRQGEMPENAYHYWAGSELYHGANLVQPTSADFDKDGKETCVYTPLFFLISSLAGCIAGKLGGAI